MAQESHEHTNWQRNMGFILPTRFSGYSWTSSHSNLQVPGSAPSAGAWEQGPWWLSWAGTLVAELDRDPGSRRGDGTICEWKAKKKGDEKQKLRGQHK